MNGKSDKPSFLQKFFSEVVLYFAWLKTLNLEKIDFWLECARVYSLPITLLNWVVIFIYSLKTVHFTKTETEFESIILGIMCFIGMALVHMATNLIDDYYDYKILVSDKKFLASAQNCKCKYLKDGLATTKDLKFAIITFLGLAAAIGCVLFCSVGMYVAFLALAGLVIAIFYQKLSLLGLGEIAIILAYGPLLFEGTYYVMTRDFSMTVLILSFACSMFTNSILYAHMLMDYDGDESAHKVTLCRKFKSKTKALNFLLVFYSMGLALMWFLAYRTNNNLYFLTCITAILIADLYKSLWHYNIDRTNIPVIRFWHKPLDNWDEISKTQDAPFYFRFLYSRNIVTWFMILTCVAIIWG